MPRQAGFRRTPLRALIVLCSALVVALAVMTVLYVDQHSGARRTVGPRFQVSELVQDARPGEFAIYREEASGRRLRFVVVERPETAGLGVPYLVIRRDLLGRDGRPRVEEGASISYEHQIVQHAWFPFLTPEVPTEYDRVWTWREISREPLRRRGKSLPAWRVDLLDPSLPASADTVAAWFDAGVPVYGLLQWRRNNETWVFERGGGGSS